MATKNNPGEFDCYAAADPDEPIFILRATDRIAPKMVRQWAAIYQVDKSVRNMKEGNPAGLTESQGRKFDEAMACADAMEAWRRKQPQCPVCGSVHVEGTNCRSCGFSAT